MISNEFRARAAVQPGAMRKKPSRLADTVRMRAWRDRKGGTKPAAPPAAPTVLEHWLAKWRESMKERGNAPATVVSQTDHAWHFIRWCHASEVRDPRVNKELLGHTRLDTTAIYTHVSNERLCKIHADCHPRGRTSGLIELTGGGETVRGPVECRQYGGGSGI